MKYTPTPPKVPPPHNSGLPCEISRKSLKPLMRKLGKTTGEILWDLDASAGPKVSAN